MVKLLPYQLSLDQPRDEDGKFAATGASASGKPAIVKNAEARAKASKSPDDVKLKIKRGEPNSSHDVKSVVNVGGHDVAEIQESRQGSRDSAGFTKTFSVRFKAEALTALAGKPVEAAGSFGVTKFNSLASARRHIQVQLHYKL